MPESDASLDMSASESSSVFSLDSDEDYRQAQEDWLESLAELEQLLMVMLLPWFGKWMGRWCSHWAYNRYVRLGLGKAFFLGEKVLLSK